MFFNYHQGKSTTAAVINPYNVISWATNRLEEFDLNCDRYFIKVFFLKYRFAYILDTLANRVNTVLTRSQPHVEMLYVGDLIVSPDQV